MNPDNLTLPQIKRDVVRVCAEIHRRGWVANHEGNITVRLAEGKFLATPTAMGKAEIREQDLIIIDGTKRVIQGSRKPFGEIGIHLAVYAARSDVNAVIHAHPVTATGFAVSGIELSQPIIPEIVVSMGLRVPMVPFAVPAGHRIIELLQPFLEDHDALMLKNHGVLTYGDTLDQALLRMEHVENWARILFISIQTGRVDALPDDAVHELLEARRKAGFGIEGRKLKI
jgi:L-fuculose-phosphate aldolase